MEQTSKLYMEILGRITAARKKQLRVSLIQGVLAALAVTLAAILTTVVFEQIFRFDTTGRTILFSLASIAITASVAWFVARPVLRILGVLPSVSDAALARKIGDRFPHVRDRLLDALQLFQAREQLKSLYSPQLIDAAFEDLYFAIQSLDFSEAIDSTPVRRMRKVAAYSAVLFLLMFILSPSGFLSSFDRILRFNVTFASPSPIELFVEPGDVEIVRGGTVPLTIRSTGRPISTLQLHTRQSGQLHFETTELRGVEEVNASTTMTFRDSLQNVRATTEYYASASGVESPKYRITVVDRPLIRSFRVHLQYPSYTRLPARLLDENVGDVSAYKGTIVSVNVTASKELASAELVFNDNTTVRMNVEGSVASGRFPLTAEKSYRVKLVDAEGLTNADPIEYRLRIIPDAFPSIAILVPGKNVDVSEQMQLDLLIRITDDFGFSKLRLAHRLAHSRYERPAEEFTFVDIPLPSRELTTQEVWYRWSLTGMKLVPEDIVAYYAEVFDNDNVSGPKSAQSETYFVRLPSLDEVFKDIAQMQSESMESMQSAYSDLQQLRREITELQNEMRRERPKIDWQQQRKADEMVKKFEEMKQKLDETTRKLDEAVKHMQENKVLSRETLEKFFELQKLMQEFNQPELLEALKKLQEGMKQLSPEQIREAMEKLQMTEELFRRSLERTIELLKRLAIEQKMDELIRRTEELIKQQEELRQQTGETDPSDRGRLDELARRQEDLQQQLDALREQLADLQKKMEEFPTEMPLDRMSEAQQNLEQQQLGQQMQEAAQQMRSGQQQRAQQGQQKISQQMQQLLQQLRAAQEEMRANQQRQVMNEMRKQLQNLLELSKRQEQLKEETSGLDPNSARFRENAQAQMEVQDDLSKVANALMQLSRKTFVVSPEMGRELGKAMQEMQQSMQAMEQRNPAGAAQRQNEAMASLNRAATMMQDAMDALMDGGGMGMAGLMQQLQQMTGQQMGINLQSQSLMGEGQGMTPQQAAEWSRLAGQQEAVRKSLQELEREARISGELSKLLGDLDRIAQEMIEVQTDMEQGNVNPETLQKQDRILSRLLDSQRSMRERDYEQRRRAEAGRTPAGASPPDIDITTREGRNRLRQELLKVLEQRYARDYEELIRRYFEALERDQNLH